MRFLTFVLLGILSGCTDRRHLLPEPDAQVLPDSGPRDSGPPRDGGPGDVLVYAHSHDTLYTFSAQSLQVTLIGAFHTADGQPGANMLDLAVNANNEIYTSSNQTLFRVDPTTALITPVGDFDFSGDEKLYALTFLAMGELHSDRETLIGATNQGAYYEVDVHTARATPLGSYPDGWTSSGDLVSVQGLGTYATLRRSDFTSDVLARILFAADGSSAVTVIGPVRDGSTDFVQLFGLGYWGRSIYAFSNTGQLVEVDRDTGAGRIATGQTGTTEFWGAGVTTLAPVLF